MAGDGVGMAGGLCGAAGRGRPEGGAVIDGAFGFFAGLAVALVVTVKAYLILEDL